MYYKSYKNKKRLPNAPENIETHIGVHEPVVDRNDWEKVQHSFECKYRKPKHTEKNMFAGYLRCSDCGGNMRYKFTYPNHDNHYFSCGKYRESLCKQTHHIRVDVLERLTLSAIDNAVRFARDFEDEFVKIVVSEKYKQVQITQRENQRKLDTAKRREQELDMLFARIYEDNALGKLPDVPFQKLSDKYHDEADALSEIIRQLEAVVKEEQANEMDVNNFLAVVQQYTRVNQITPEILREFIHHIVVHHRETLGTETVQKVEIYFNFIGEVSLPDVEQRLKLLKTLGKKKSEQSV